MGSIGMPEMVVILVIALIIFGPRKLPELGKSLGKSLAEFKRASNDLKTTLEEEIRVEERQVRLPAWSATALTWTSIAGIVLIPAVVAVLAIRAYLPGTGERSSSSRGFAVETPRPPGAT